MNQFEIDLLLGYLIALIPLIVVSDRSEKPLGVILCGIFFSPLVGWIAWAFTLKPKKVEDKTILSAHAQQKLANYQARARETAALDPVDQWEQHQANASMSRKALPPLRKH